MFYHSFESMGTLWQINVNADDVPKVVIKEIEEKSNEFDQQYSRFISTSEANKFRNAKASTYSISKPLAEMLEAAQKLLQLTDGAFDVSIATLFEEIGYDSEYNFKKAPERIDWNPPKWSVNGTQLTIDDPIVFDIGGIGKGYWIDEISKILISHDFKFHLVDGGGDMFGTTKEDGSPWRIAIEYPGRPDTAIGMVALKNQGLAISDVFKRKWKSWHHLINAKTNTPIKQLIGNAALAPSAFLADQMTSCLSFATDDKYPAIAKELHAEYLVMNSDESLNVSKGWSGEVF